MHAPVCRYRPEDRRGEFHLIAAGAIVLTRGGCRDPDPAARSGRPGDVHDAADDRQQDGPASALNGKYALTDTWSLQGNLYIRGFAQEHVDGNVADFERCSNSASPQFRDHLCLEDDGFPRPNPVTTAFRDQFAILDQNNNTIPCPPGSGNTCTRDAVRDHRPHRKPRDHIGRFAAGRRAPRSLFGHGNNFLVGGSI